MMRSTVGYREFLVACYETLFEKDVAKRARTVEESIIQAEFNGADLDFDGYLSKEEFMTLVDKKYPDMSKDVKVELMKAVDLDGNEQISVREYLIWRLAANGS